MNANAAQGALLQSRPQAKACINCFGTFYGPGQICGLCLERASEAALLQRRRLILAQAPGAALCSQIESPGYKPGTFLITYPRRAGARLAGCVNRIMEDYDENPPRTADGHLEKEAFLHLQKALRRADY